MEHSHHKREKVSQQTLTSITEPVCSDLPQDIIEDILFRLPVQTLGRFRCVCKPWLNMISNPEFIKTHLSKSLLSNNYTNHRLILSHHGPSGILKPCSLKISNNSNNNAVVLDYPTRNNLRSCYVLGSCNGLVCIMNNDVSIFLWNPCTKKSKQLPVSPIESDGLQSTHYGFGYDQTSDDYKVVRIASYIGVKWYLGKQDVTVYSLRTDSWKKTEDFPLGFPYNGRGEFVNGILYWKIRQLGDFYRSVVIISFDLSRETYEIIPQPCYDEGLNPRVDLGVLQERLSIFCHYNLPDKTPCFNIWVMKECSVKNSWTKLYTIPYGTRTSSYSYFLLCITMTGEILLKYEFRLVLYNPTSGRFSNPKIDYLSRRTLRGLSAITYVESLVSPKIDDAVPDPQH